MVQIPAGSEHLPDDVTFITTQELEDRYPDKTPKERENLITKEYGCVFLMKIGDKLASGEPHDGRAPDYDDWQLNGDILFWHDTLDCALEISSMGIRVDEKSLASQLKKAGCEDRRELPYHKMLLHGELPYTIGGGIGQSRLCMLLLDRAHVGEVQASLWPEEMRQTCREHDIIPFIDYDVGVKSPNYDAYGLFRALHSHNPPNYSHIVGLSSHF